MMLHFFLAITGACVGSFANLAIYRLGIVKRNDSPWSTASPNHSRRALHYLPVLGWLFRQDEKLESGNGLWLRPFLIELSLAIGLPLFYVWQSAFGLTGGIFTPPTWPTIWFVGHSVLFVLLIIATFVDFDQRIIPDSITVTGTIVGLVLAAFFPSFRLPVVFNAMAGPAVRALHFADGAALPTWHTTLIGLFIGLAIYWIWILALLPKMPLMGLNLKSLQMVIVSTTRLLRKNGLKAREKSRRVGWFFITLGFLGSALLVFAWFSLPANRDSLFGALVGLGFGGLMIWSVRIVASHSLGQEAMGFGDVTLMAMIGTFLGWQAALLTFAFSPFAALAIVLFTFIVTKQNELAFGPYLCLGAVITLFGWSNIWPWARNQFFISPLILVGGLTFSLLLLAVMMRFVRRLKGI